MLKWASNFVVTDLFTVPGFLFIEQVQGGFWTEKGDRWDFPHDSAQSEVHKDMFSPTCCRKTCLTYTELWSQHILNKLQSRLCTRLYRPASVPKLNKASLNGSKSLQPGSKNQRVSEGCYSSLLRLVVWEWDVQKSHMGLMFGCPFSAMWKT